MARKLNKHKRKLKKKAINCAKKIHHLTKESAEEHLEALVLKGTPRASIKIYVCDICGKFHLTTHRNNTRGRWND